MILAIFDLQVTPILPIKFPVNGPFYPGEEDFQDGNCGSHPVFPIGSILAIFDLQVTSMILTKFQVNWPLNSGEAKNRFSRWPPSQPSWISDRNNFSYF